MASNPNPADTSQPRRPFDPTRLVYGLLSYLVPGLGQVVDRRYAKGLLFFVCVYGLFFYGTWIGSASAKDELTGREYTASPVYLPSAPPPPDPNRQKQAEEPGAFETLKYNLVTRWQFVGQFWVGVAAWPAIFQYRHYNLANHGEVEKDYHEAHDLLRQMNKKIQSGAGEDDEKVKELREQAESHLNRARKMETDKLAHPLFGSYQREPSQASANAVHNAGDKRLELAWVFTVIAGVLNLLVIYDAVIGPTALPQKKAS